MRKTIPLILILFISSVTFSANDSQPTTASALVVCNQIFANPGDARGLVEAQSDNLGEPELDSGQAESSQPGLATLEPIESLVNDETQVIEHAPTQGTESPESDDLVALLVSQSDQMRGLLEEFKLNGYFSRGRRRLNQSLGEERPHMVEGLRRWYRTGDPAAREILRTWSEHNQFWLEQAEQFRSLSPEASKEYKKHWELAVSIATRHLLVFAESRHFHKWKLERLMSILTVHRRQGLRSDPKLSLFMLSREVQKYYSEWDFINCRY